MSATRTLAVVCGGLSWLLYACDPSVEERALAPRAAAISPGAVGIYDDALLSGWSDLSWSSTRNFAATSPVASGSASLAVAFGTWGGLFFRHPGGLVSGVGAVELSVNGGSVAGSKLQIWVGQSGAQLTHVDLVPYCAGGVIPANAWTRCKVPMSALAPAGAAIDAVLIEEMDGVARTLYFDDIQLDPVAPAAPAGLTAVAQASAVSLGWAAVAGATGYDVYRGTATAGPFTRLTAAPQASTTYADTTVAGGGTFWYRVTASNAGGTSAPGAAVSATVSAPAPTGAVGIYDDALLPGWADWSWSSTRNFAATSPVASGRNSLAVTFGTWGGLFFRHTAGLVSGVSTVELSVNGGSVAGSKLQIWVGQGNAQLTHVDLVPYCAGGVIPANAWTRCKVPMSALAPPGTAIDGILIEEMDGATRTLTFDDVTLTTGSGTVITVPAAPTGLAAVAQTGAVSLSWAGVTGATGYDVYRATASAGPFTRLTAAPQPSTTYADTAVTAGSAYWYQVTAGNTAGSSPASATVSATVPAPPPITVSISPGSATLDACTTARFSATVSGTASQTVTWSVLEGATGGAVDASGSYTGPAASGTYHLVATSSAPGSPSASVAVVVQDHVLALALTPVAPALFPGGSQQFAALVTTTCGTFSAE